MWVRDEARVEPYDWTADPPQREYDSFFKAFASGQLASIHWTHYAHCVAAIYVECARLTGQNNYSLPALIQRHNLSTGTADTSSSGYHHTITLCYIELVSRFVAAFSTKTSLPVPTQLFLKTRLARPDLLLQFYSSSVLLSGEARKAWVDPDIRPLYNEYEIAGLLRAATPPIV